MTTPNLILPELVANQAQPHIPLNAALRLLDAAVQAIVTYYINDPPDPPGTRYLVGDAPTGAWEGHAQHIAVWNEETFEWIFLVPQVGWLVFVQVALKFYVFNGTVWQPLTTGGSGAATDPLYNAKGDILVGTADNAATRLPIGINTHVLTADSAVAPAGLKWAAPAAYLGSGSDPIYNAPGDIVVGTADNAADRLPVGANTQILTADSTKATGVKWAAAKGGGSASGVAADEIWNAKGDMIVGTGPDEGATVAIGTNAYMLTADSSAPTGMKWKSPPVPATRGVAASGAMLSVVATPVQSASRNQSVYVLLDNLIRDDGGYWSAANPSRLTVSQAGWYIVQGTVGFAGPGVVTIYDAYISINRAYTRGGVSLTTIGTCYLSPFAIVRLNAGDYVELVIRHMAGSAINLPRTAGFTPVLTIHQLSTP